MAKHNDGKHIIDVVSRAECKQHAAPVGIPCWNVFPDSQSEASARAVCGSRIRSAGYVGRISETAMQTKRKLLPIKRK